MGIEELADGDLRITGVPGFEKTVFLPSNGDYQGNLLLAVRSVEKRGVRLQTAPEAVALFIASEGGYDSAESQLTSSAALGFLYRGVPSLAFDDSVEGNLIHAYAERGVEANNILTEGNLSSALNVPLSEPLVRDAIARATDAGRVLPAPSEPFRLGIGDERLVEQRLGTDEYVRAILGDDLAARYDDSLVRLVPDGYTMSFGLATASDIMRHLTDTSHAILWPVTFGPSRIHYGIDAYSLFEFSSGIARGVRDAARPQ